jgi:hypothetical protein
MPVPVIAERNAGQDRLNLRTPEPFSVGNAGAIGDGLADDYNALFEAAKKQGTSGAIFLPPGTYAVGTSLTIACQVIFAFGAKLKPDTGVTVTLAGPVTTAPGDGIIAIGTGGTVSITGTLESSNGVVDVRTFGAVGDGVTDDSAAIQQALDAAALFTDGTVVCMSNGTYNCGSTTIVIPSMVVLHFDGAILASGATNATEIALGSDSTSGGISATSQSSGILHTGTGYGIYCNGSGESRANVTISGLTIEGSASGTAGLYTSAFNRMTTTNLKVKGYTTGSAHLNEGANAITHFSPSFEGCLHGMDNVSVVRSLVEYSANAVVMFGGHIFACAGWGWRERKTSGTGPNLGNLISGCTFENNGLNASATSGHIFVQFSVSLKIQGCYFEDYAGTVPVSAVLIGDGSTASQSIQVVGNLFATSGTNVINNVNGQSVWVEGNHAAGAATNFVAQGADARLLVVRGNRASAVANYFSGLDNGGDSIVDAPDSTFVNSSSPTIRGFGFNAISGLSQDLAIRTRLGGVSCVNFLAIDGTVIGGLSNGGSFNVIADYKVSGLKVIGSQQPQVADSTGAGDVVAQLNTLLSRLRSHGLIAT